MAELRVSVLGLLRVERDGEPVRLGPQQVALLSVLLLEAGRSVPAARLMRLLWDTPQPDGRSSTLRSHVSNLRRALGPRCADSASGPSTASPQAGLVTTVGVGAAIGYRLDLRPEQIDAHRFERGYAEGRRLFVAGETARSAALIGEALALWHGPAYADVAERAFARPAISRLDALRRAARRTQAEALIALGRHSEVVGELTRAVADDPYDEGPRRLLALALYHEDRVDEAAALCRDGLALLRDRGLDAPELAELQRTILRRTVPTGERWAAPIADGVRPCLLPPEQTRFVGRRDEVAKAQRILSDRWPRPVTLLVTGPAGVGKTTFAVRVAHAVAERFPDGQLYAKLYEPADPSVVLGGFLRALGVRGAAVPTDQTDRMQLYRSLLARRQVLVVLDDAAHAAQIRPLLPNGPGCAVIVTSRTSLAGIDGVRTPLGILTDEQALLLLRDMIGGERVDAEPAAARAIVGRCGHLPLAVWVVGARLAARPHWLLGAMADGLADEHRRLDLLTVGDVAVRASVELTYRSLAEDARRALRLLGLTRARDFSPWLLAALMDIPVGHAEQLFDDLIEVHLLDPVSMGAAGVRYRLHDLVRLYARERAVAEERTPARTAALHRMLGACLDLAERAGARLSADFLGLVRHRTPHWTFPASEAEALVGDPLTWFDREHGCLVAAIDEGLDAGVTDLAGCIATSLTTYFQVRNRFDDWRRVQSKALAVAVAADDRRTALKLHRSLGELDTIQDRYPDALAHFQAAEEFGTTDDPEYEAAVTSGLGYLYRLLGRYDHALRYQLRARDMARQTGNISGMVYAENSIGVVYLERNLPDDARAQFTEALRHSRQAGYLPGEAQSLRCLGQAHRAAHDYAAAARYYHQAYEISIRLGDRLVAAHAACWLGDIQIRQGRHAEGRRLLAQCLWTYREFGNVWGQAAVLTALAEAHLAVGRPAQALRRARQAVAIWRRVGSPYWLATGLEVLSRALRAAGDPVGADRVCVEVAALREGVLRKAAGHA
jgi:DNA-binding SARP family transcriptional activator